MIAGPKGGMLNRTVGRVNFDFTSTAPNQLSLRKGAMITIVQKGEPGGWSKGMDEQGEWKILLMGTYIYTYIYIMGTYKYKYP